MGVLDRFKNILGGNEEDEDEDFDITSTQFAENEKDDQPIRVTRSKQDTQKISSKMQFIIVKPEKLDECREIGNHILQNKVVVLNIESTGREIARRIIDFLDGITFAVGGQIKKVSALTYLILPKNSEISGDILDELENGGVFF